MSDRDLPQARELAHLRQPKREQPTAQRDRHPAARLQDELQQHLGNRGLQALLRGERSDPTSAHLLALLERARAGWDVVELLPWKGPMSWTRERCGLSSSDRVDPTRDEVLAEFSELLGVDLSNVDVRTTGAGDQGARAVARRDGSRDQAVFGSRHVDRETVAHELAHVAQRRLVGAQEQAPLSRVDSPAEREASHAASQLARGLPFQVSQPLDAAAMRDALPGSEAIDVWHALNSVFDPDPQAGLEALRRGGPATRTAYQQHFGRRLEEDFWREATDSDVYVQALEVLWPVMNAEDRAQAARGSRLEERFVAFVSRRVLINLTANEHSLRSEVQPRYEGAGAAAELATLRGVVDELVAYRTLGAHQVQVLVALGDSRAALAAAFAAEGSQWQAEALSALTARTRQVTTTLAALLAAQGRLLQRHPEAARFVDDSGAPDRAQLEAVTDDSYRSSLEGLDDETALQVLGTHITQVLEALFQARAGVRSGDIEVLDLDQVVAPLLGELGDSLMGAVGRRVVQEHQAAERREDLVVGGVAVGLFCASTFLTGGLATAAQVGSAALGVGDGLVNMEEALDTLLLAQAHLDPDQAMVDGGEAQEALFWAGLEVALSGLELAGCAAAVKSAETAKQAVAARAALLADLQRIVGPDDLDELRKFLGVAVELDEALGPRDIRVLFPGPGEATRVRLGAAATVADVKLHAETVALARRYEGVVGRVRVLWHDLTAWMQGADPQALQGARELQAEIDKVLLLQQARRDVLGQTGLAEGLQASLETELVDLELAEVRLRDGLTEVKSGRGWVGQRTEWHALKMEDPGDQDPEVGRVAADHLNVFTPTAKGASRARVLAGTPVDRVLGELLSESDSLRRYLDMFCTYVDKDGKAQALEALRGVVGDVAAKDWTVEVLRRHVKAELEPGVLAWLMDRPPEQGQRLLMAVTDGINSSDKGRLSEKFYAATELTDPAGQVRVVPGQLGGQQVALAKEHRRLDFVQQTGSVAVDDAKRAALLAEGYPQSTVASLGDRLGLGRVHEVKSGKTLPEGEMQQIEDIVGMVAGKPPLIVDGTQLREAVVTFMDVRAPRQQVERLKAAMKQADGRLCIEIYDSKGSLHQLGPSAVDLDLLKELN